VKAVADAPGRRTDSIEVAQNADVKSATCGSSRRSTAHGKALAFHQYVTGPVFIARDLEHGREKYGSDHRASNRNHHDAGRHPRSDRHRANLVCERRRRVRLYSVLEVAIPWEAKTREDLDWLRCEVMRSKWKLLDQYRNKDPKGPSPLEQYRDQDVPDDDYASSSTSAQEARDAVGNPSGTGQGEEKQPVAILGTLGQAVSLRAATNPEARKVLREQFPDGLYIARVGSITVEIDNRQSHRRVGHLQNRPRRKDHGPPLCADAIPLNVAIDDLFGMAIETVLRAITQTIMDSQLIDREAMNEQRGSCRPK
jgi:hypothetical protein